MVAGVTLTMAMVILTMAGVTHPMAGVIHPMAGVILTDTDLTGQVIIVDIGTDIMADTDTITPHLITPIQKEVGATGMVTASQDQVFRDMVPGA